MTSVCMLLQGHYEIDIRVRRKAEALVAAGYQVDVLALKSPYSKAASYVLDGVNVHTLELGKKRGSRWRYLFEYVAYLVWVTGKLSRLMHRRRYELVEVNTLPDFLVFATFYARWKGARIVLDMHEITPEFYISKYKVQAASWPVRMLAVIERLSMHYADHVITINEPIQRLLQGRGLPEGKSTIIMNSADDSLFVAQDAIADGESGQQDRFVMMYHGTLTNIYGLDIAIDAFSRASERMPGAELWILGSGPELERLKALAQRLRVETKVKFIGPVLPQEVHLWLRRCDVGVLATRQDVFLDLSFSNKLSEYILMRKAVIAARLKTIRHYFSEEALAFFEPENPADLAAKMDALYRGSDLRRSLAEHAYREFQPIRWEVMRDRYLELVAAMVRRSPPRDAPVRPDVDAA